MYFLNLSLCPFVVNCWFLTNERERNRELISTIKHEMRGEKRDEVELGVLKIFFFPRFDVHILGLVEYYWVSSITENFVWLRNLTKRTGPLKNTLLCDVLHLIYCFSFVFDVFPM